MATYSDINDTRASVSVPITQTDIEAAETALAGDVYSAFNSLAYSGLVDSSYTSTSVYELYSDGTELWAVGSFSQGNTHTVTSFYLESPNGFYIEATGNSTFNSDTWNFSKFSDFEFGNDTYNIEINGAVGMSDGVFTGNASSVTYAFATLDPLVWDSIIFTGSAKFDANGNLTGTITGVDFGAWVSADPTWETVEWVSDGKVTGLKTSMSSLEGLTSFDSLFALNVGGNDKLTGTAGDDYIDASTGNDTVDGLAGNDEIYGGAGNDKLTDTLGNNTLDGGDGNNTITAGAGDDTIYAGSGNDKVSAGDGVNSVGAGDGNNTITTGAGADDIYSGSGNDKITAGDGMNYVDAGDGNNTITAGSGDDEIYGGTGNDKITAGDGSNFVVAWEGNDTITTGAGGDEIYGGAGNDKITAGAGDDFIVSGSGADKVSGGLGGDYFIFNNLAVGGFDTISDFSAAEDTLLFDTSVFTALAGGITADNLCFGAAAQDANDYMVFNAKGGKLYYDADGSGSGSAVQIAILKGSVSGLAEGNFDTLLV